MSVTMSIRYRLASRYLIYYSIFKYSSLSTSLSTSSSTSLSISLCTSLSISLSTSLSVSSFTSCNTFKVHCSTFCITMYYNAEERFLLSDSYSGCHLRLISSQFRFSVQNVSKSKILKKQTFFWIKQHFEKSQIFGTFSCPILKMCEHFSLFYLNLSEIRWNSNDSMLSYIMQFLIQPDTLNECVNATTGIYYISGIYIAHTM